MNLYELSMMYRVPHNNTSAQSHKIGVQRSVNLKNLVKTRIFAQWWRINSDIFDEVEAAEASDIVRFC